MFNKQIHELGQPVIEEQNNIGTYVPDVDFSVSGDVREVPHTGIGDRVTDSYPVPVAGYYLKKDKKSTINAYTPVTPRKLVDYRYLEEGDVNDLDDRTDGKRFWVGMGAGIESSAIMSAAEAIRQPTPPAVLGYHPKQDIMALKARNYPLTSDTIAKLQQATSPADFQMILGKTERLSETSRGAGESTAGAITGGALEDVALAVVTGGASLAVRGAIKVKTAATGIATARKAGQIAKAGAVAKEGQLALGLAKESQLALEVAKQARLGYRVPTAIGIANAELKALNYTGRLALAQKKLELAKTTGTALIQAPKSALAIIDNAQPAAVMKALGVTKVAPEAVANMSKVGVAERLSHLDKYFPHLDSGLLVALSIYSYNEDTMSGEDAIINSLTTLGSILWGMRKSLKASKVDEVSPTTPERPLAFKPDDEVKATNARSDSPLGIHYNAGGTGSFHYKSHPGWDNLNGLDAPKGFSMNDAPHLDDDLYLTQNEHGVWEWRNMARPDDKGQPIWQEPDDWSDAFQNPNKLPNLTPQLDDALEAPRELNLDAINMDNIQGSVNELDSIIAKGDMPPEVLTELTKSRNALKDSLPVLPERGSVVEDISEDYAKSKSQDEIARALTAQAVANAEAKVARDIAEREAVEVKGKETPQEKPKAKEEAPKVAPKKPAKSEKQLQNDVSEAQAKLEGFKRTLEGAAKPDKRVGWLMETIRDNIEFGKNKPEAMTPMFKRQLQGYQDELANLQEAQKLFQNRWAGQVKKAESILRDKIKALSKYKEG